MSSVKELRHRLVFEQLQRWLKKLRREEPIEPEELAELAVRLLAMAMILLKRHQVNKRGQCQYCGWRRWNWRFWKKRSQCTIFNVLVFTLDQELAVVWWRLFGSLGRGMSLEEVKKWMQGSQ